MAEQLTIPGVPAPKPLIPNVWSRMVAEAMADAAMLQADVNRLLFEARYCQEPLFKREAPCDAHAGDLDCVLYTDHSGPHWDAYHKVEWNYR